MQVHQGDEVPRVRSGQILIRCRDQQRTWREGAPVVVALGVAHGFRVATETVPGVVAEADIGTLYPGVSDGGEAELAEPYRGDGRPPGQGQEGERACGQATGGNGTPRHPRLVYRISSWTWNAQSCPSMHGLSGAAGISVPATLIQSPARAAASPSALSSSSGSRRARKPAGHTTGTARCPALTHTQYSPRSVRPPSSGTRKRPIPACQELVGTATTARAGRRLAPPSGSGTVTCVAPPSHWSAKSVRVEICALRIVSGRLHRSEPDCSEDVAVNGDRDRLGRRIQVHVPVTPLACPPGPRSPGTSRHRRERGCGSPRWTASSAGCSPQTGCPQARPARPVAMWCCASLRILVPIPCAFATSTARPGGEKYVPDDIRFQILYSLPFRSFSKSATDSPSTPGAPLFALTFSHASQTARLEISNGLPGNFSSSTRLLPENFWLIERTQPRTARPLRSALITRASALLRAGPPARPATVLSPSRHQHRLERSLSPARASGPGSIGTRLLLFRAEAADRARVVYMPDTAWPVSGHPPGSSRGSQNTPVSMSSEWVSTRQQRFACARLTDPHLTPLTTPFPHRSPRRSSANAA